MYTCAHTVYRYGTYVVGSKIIVQEVMILYMLVNFLFGCTLPGSHYHHLQQNRATSRKEHGHW